MIIKQTVAIAVYNGEEKPIAIVLMDEKSRKNIVYQVEEMAFEDIAHFLERISNTKLEPLPVEGRGGTGK